MKKLKIEMEQLQVETFDLEAISEQRGTVQARVPYTHPGWCPPSEDVYCTYGDCSRYPEFTCGGYDCQTWEGQICYRPTDPGSICSPVET
jgi:hypothetical protein